MRNLRILGALPLVVSLGACFSPAANLPKGDAAYALMPPAKGNAGLGDYKIGVQDVISVRVFQEPDLTFEEIQVDASGTINFPLVGRMVAAGKTPFELSNSIEDGLSRGFIRSPQVVVGVVESAALRVTVEGNVAGPGVFEIAGNTTLLEAIARAKGPTNTAALDEVVVFRDIEGERMGAVFNLQDIREGKAPDPQIVGGDRIVVGFSGLKGAYRDFILAAPIFNVFARF